MRLSNKVQFAKGEGPSSRCDFREAFLVKDFDFRDRTRLFSAFSFSVFLHAIVLFLAVPQTRLLSAGSYSSQQGDDFSRLLYAELKSGYVESSLTVENSPLGSHEASGLGAALLRLSTEATDGEKSFKESSVSRGKNTLQIPSVAQKQPLVPAASEATLKKASEGLKPVAGYVNSAQLDPPPQLLSEVTLNYPEGAMNQQGKVVLRLLISEAGRVDRIDIARATPEGFFEHAAIAAFKEARFSEGRLLGIPVKSQLFLEVDFLPFNRGAAVSGKGY